MLKDLRILEQQQKESAKELQTARETKQVRLKQLDAKEAELQRLKYNNGQLRAQLQRMHERLSQGQRSLGDCKASSSNARRGLELFEHQLHRALRDKRGLCSDERRVQRSEKTFDSRLEKLSRLCQDMNEHVQRAEDKHRRIQEQEESLRQQVKAAEEENQSIQQDIEKFRAEGGTIERTISAIQSEEATKLQQIKTLKKQLLDEDQRAEQSQSLVDTALQEERAKTEEVKVKVSAAQKEAETKKELFQQALERIRAIKSSEGHPLSPQADGSAAPPSLDMDLLHESVKLEADAASNEKASRKELEAEVESLRKELSEETAKLQEKMSLESEKKEEIDALREEQKVRKQTHESCLVQHGAASEELEALKKKVPELQKQRDANNAQAKERLQDAETKLEDMQQELAGLRADLQAKEQEAEELDAEFKDLLDSTALDEEGLKTKIVEKQKLFDALEKEKSSLDVKHVPEGIRKLDLDKSLSLDKMKREISKLVRGKW